MTSTKVSWKYNKPLKLATPLLDKTKAEIVKLGTDIGAPLNLTRSCYENDEMPCGKCDAHEVRQKAFEAGIRDTSLL